MRTEIVRRVRVDSDGRLQLSSGAWMLGDDLRGEGINVPRHNYRVRYRLSPHERYFVCVRWSDTRVGRPGYPGWNVTCLNFPRSWVGKRVTREVLPWR